MGGFFFVQLNFYFFVKMQKKLERISLYGTNVDLNFIHYFTNIILSDKIENVFKYLHIPSWISKSKLHGKQ